MNASTTKKATKMAKAPTTSVDINNMTATELETLIKEASAIVSGKRKAELKDIIDTFTTSLSAHGFTKAEGIEALGGVPPTPKARSASGTKAPKQSGPKPKRGQAYKNPADNTIWTASPTGKGSPAKWLREAVAAGKTFEEFEAK